MRATAVSRTTKQREPPLLKKPYTAWIRLRCPASVENPPNAPVKSLKVVHRRTSPAATGVNGVSTKGGLVGGSVETFDGCVGS